MNRLPYVAYELIVLAMQKLGPLTLFIGDGGYVGIQEVFNANAITPDVACQQGN